MRRKHEQGREELLESAIFKARVTNSIITIYRIPPRKTNFFKKSKMSIIQPEYHLKKLVKFIS